MPFEDLEKSFTGDERAQMRTIIESLALQLKLVTLHSSVAVLKQASYDLADAALEYLKGEDPPAESK